MTILRAKEVNGMSAKDRAQRLSDLRVELARMRTMINAGGAVEDPTRVHELRKAIAIILTVQNEVKLGIRQAPQEPEKSEKKQEKKPEKKAEEPAEEPKKAEKKPRAKKEAKAKPKETSE